MERFPACQQCCKGGAGRGGSLIISSNCDSAKRENAERCANSGDTEIVITTGFAQLEPAETQ